MMDFTLTAYKEILNSFIFKKYKIFTVSKYIDSKKKTEKCLILRHDVDRKPKNALNMAKLENKMGVSSTYYFRIKGCSFDKEILKQIYKLGHEIGYHYENLSDCKGNYKKAIIDFENNLKKFPKICKIKSISMHGSPFSKFDNRDLWKKYSYKKFGISNEVYFSINYENIYFFTDTGRSWSSKNNIRDFIPGKHLVCKSNIKSSDQLVKLFRKNNKNVLMSTHPERWSNNVTDYIIQLGKDTIINFIKKIIKLIR